MEPEKTKICDQQSVGLHAQWSRALVKTRLGHLIGLLSSFQYTSAEGESICCIIVGGDMPWSAGYYWTFFWLAKQPKNKLARG